MADRGFNIEESVAAMGGATLVIPAFTRGTCRDQLSANEIEDTRKLANKRIHVERVIGSIRQRYSATGVTMYIKRLCSG